ncbi:MAG: hypothetical protein ABIJ48_11345, partial [Actinomycetota bacterium]
MSDGPTRPRLPPRLAPAFAAAGWLEDGTPSPAAAGLLAALRSGPDPDGALTRLGASFTALPALGAEALA